MIGAMSRSGQTLSASGLPGAVRRPGQPVPARGRRDAAGRWPRRQGLMDGAIVVFAFGFSALYAFAGASISRLPVWVSVLLTIALVAPLAVRRRWPVAVFAWCFTVAAASGWWANQVVWSVGLLVALYTV